MPRERTFTQFDQAKVIKLQKVWSSMKKRCYLSTSTNYKYYGGRGITVCNQWNVNSSKAFIEWAFSSGYEHGLSLERRDNNGNYCPENCYWASPLAQGQNKRNNTFVKWEGSNYTVGAFERTMKMRPGYIHHACVRSGLTLVQAVAKSKTSQPYAGLVRKKNNHRPKQKEPQTRQIMLDKTRTAKESIINVGKTHWSVAGKFFELW